MANASRTEAHIARPLVQLGSGHDSPAVDQAQVGGDRLGRARVVAGHHDAVDPGTPQLVERCGGAGPGFVGDADEVEQRQAGDPLLVELGAGGEDQGNSGVHQGSQGTLFRVARMGPVPQAGP